jgi:hypothetical protein
VAGDVAGDVAGGEDDGEPDVGVPVPVAADVAAAGVWDAASASRIDPENEQADTVSMVTARTVTIPEVLRVLMAPG